MLRAAKLHVCCLAKLLGNCADQQATIKTKVASTITRLGNAANDLACSFMQTMATDPKTAATKCRDDPGNCKFIPIYIYFSPFLNITLQKTASDMLLLRQIIYIWLIMKNLSKNKYLGNIYTSVTKSHLIFFK